MRACVHVRPRVGETNVVATPTGISPLIIATAIRVWRRGTNPYGGADWGDVEGFPTSSRGVYRANSGL